MTRRADLVDNLEEKIDILQTQYQATEQKYQTMLTVSLDLDNTFLIFEGILSNCILI